MTQRENVIIETDDMTEILKAGGPEALTVYLICQTAPGEMSVGGIIKASGMTEDRVAKALYNLGVWQLGLKADEKERHLEALR